MMGGHKIDAHIKMQAPYITGVTLYKCLLHCTK